MKLLARIERKKISWLLIALCLIFFLLRLPSVIEPYWYGDEGVYEVIGQAMNQGHLLYHDIWDNKPPLLYIVYALAQGDQPTVKIFSLIIGLFTVVSFFFLAQKLFHKDKISIITTSLFVLLFATPILEANIANAENFILLPIILAGLIIYYTSLRGVKRGSNLGTKKITSVNKWLRNDEMNLFLAGLLLGIAFLFKIVDIFDLAAFLLFSLIIHLPEKLSWPSLKKNIFNLISSDGKLLIGFLLPLAIAIAYFFLNHALMEFLQAAFLGNVDYVGWKNNLFGMPQGWLILKTVLLSIGVVLIIKYRKHFSSSVLFILMWILFSLFNTYFSGRPYTHYSIVFLPSFCLFIGMLFLKQKAKVKMLMITTVILLILAQNRQFNFNTVRTYAYYQNVIAFIIGQKSVEAYQSFFDKNVPRDYTVATFIKSHTSANDKIFVWGNNPQIYAMTHKLPLGKYTVAYHILQNNAFDETQLAINKGQPKYIIVLNETQPLPFVIPLYIMRYNITGATIYERSL